MELRFRISVKGEGRTVQACWDRAIQSLLIQTPEKPIKRRALRGFPKGNAYAVVWHGDDNEEVLPDIPDRRNRI